MDAKGERAPGDWCVCMHIRSDHSNCGWNFCRRCRCEEFDWDDEQNPSLGPSENVDESPDVIR